MNIQLSQAVSDVTGVTGQAIIRAIVAGVREVCPNRSRILRHGFAGQDKFFTNTQMKRL